MNWMSFVAIGIFLAITIVGCWLLDRQGTSGPYTPGQPSTEDGIVALGVTLSAAMTADDGGSPDSGSTEASPSDT